tara:strand:- start:327 stop:476 length:150 start_codon:yes stop_codon:yes gene_type:complete
MTLKGIIKGAAPAFVGLAGLALAVRFFGDGPILKDVKEGLRGNSTSWFG